MDTAIIHNFDRGLWDELKSPAYAGAVSKLKSSSVSRIEYHGPLTRGTDILREVANHIQLQCARRPRRGP
jgi:hypothetical protein